MSPDVGPGPDSLDERQRRRAANEAVFREINERLEAVNEAFGSLTDTFEVLCECGDARCAQRLPIPPTEYERIRSDPTHFVLAPGHSAPDVEAVITQGPTWLVVQKRPGAPARAAEATDPRGD
jgi:hypothetical protein